MCGHVSERHAGGKGSHCFERGCTCEGLEPREVLPHLARVTLADLGGALAYALESAEHFLDCNQLDMVRHYLAQAGDIQRAIKHAIRETRT